MKFFLSVIGMVMIIEGLPYFAFPDKMKLWVLQMVQMPGETLRKYALVLMSIGLLLVYVGNSL
ncbi:MAG: DUF2065 domain-containing protein [Desulfobacterales bacterium]|nr:DUF2065 domain-containing protein [Desulfobacterales bacterium]